VALPRLKYELAKFTYFDIKCKISRKLFIFLVTVSQYFYAQNNETNWCKENTQLFLKKIMQFVLYIIFLNKTLKSLVNHSKNE